jgi:hypothetical protein
LKVLEAKQEPQDIDVLKTKLRFISDPLLDQFDPQNMGAPRGRKTPADETSA